MKWKKVSNSVTHNFSTETDRFKRPKKIPFSGIRSMPKIKQKTTMNNMLAAASSSLTINSNVIEKTAQMFSKPFSMCVCLCGETNSPIVVSAWLNKITLHSPNCGLCWHIKIDIKKEREKKPNKRCVNHKIVNESPNRWHFFHSLFFSLLAYGILNVMSLDGYWHDVAHTITTNNDDITTNNNVVLHKTSLWRFTARFSRSSNPFYRWANRKKANLIYYLINQLRCTNWKMIAY